MEELLPIFIGILWLLYTFFFKGKKNKSRPQQPEHENGQSEKPSFIEQLLAGEGIQLESESDDELYDEEPEPIIYEKAVPTPIKQKERPFLNSELSRFTEEGESQFYELDEVEEFSFDDPLISGIKSDQKREEFDLRKAVVYSTILETPYIDYK